MAEVAGLVLGVLPIIISVLNHKDEVSEYTLAFFRWQKAKALMTRQLALCQVDFDINMRLLLKNTVSPEKHCNMIEDPQHDSWTDSEFLQKVEEKLGKFYAVLISILRDIEGSMIWIVSSLDIAGRDELAQKGLGAIIQEYDPVTQARLPERTLRLRKRAKFTWSRHKVKAKMKKLEDCNARLNRILSASNELAESTVATDNMTVSFVGPLEEISRNASRVHDALSSSWCSLGDCNHQAAIMLEERLSRQSIRHRSGANRQYSNIGHFSILLSRDAVAAWLSAEFHLERDKPLEPTNNAQGNRRVRFEPSYIPVNQPQAHRVTDICTFIRSASAPDLRFSIDHRNVLRRLDLPGSSDSHNLQRGLSLQDLLPDMKSQSFALCDFYRLAITLASSCIQLRSTRWLHQSWNKQSILFFRPDPDGEASADMRYPYLALQSQSVNGKGGSEMERVNMLSLAIMLMEIKTGTAIECHRSPDDLGSNGKQNSSTNYLTASRWLRQLTDRGRLPWRYGDAVRYCIRFYDDYYASLEYADTQKQFREEVIEPTKVSALFCLVMSSDVHRDATKTSLRTLLWEKRTPIPDQKLKFAWPYKLLKTLMTPDLIYNELVVSSINEREATKYRDIILGEYKKRSRASPETYCRVFAILLFQGQVMNIGKFLREKLHDGLFPLDRTKGRDIAQKCFESLGWNDEDVEYFNTSGLRVSTGSDIGRKQ
ncbi:hypothetical protein FNAPI_270 [Fusarium napiforme]|uniref:DUF7580 domain-containing protein n=1 Tax=Fusarium napiforme TaxID=42672 RepID=A0A8H5K7N9_9HYPO|nr:hypothetical protein FNAPI_270 [Fusarium napiforme]